MIREVSGNQVRPNDLVWAGKEKGWVRPKIHIGGLTRGFRQEDRYIVKRRWFGRGFDDFEIDEMNSWTREGMWL